MGGRAEEGSLGDDGVAADGDGGLVVDFRIRADAGIFPHGEVPRRPYPAAGVHEGDERYFCPEQAQQQIPGHLHGVGGHHPEEGPVDDVPAVPFEAVAEGVVFLVTGQVHGGRMSFEW